jgi:uncharacterized protein (DUF427 family)
VPAEDIRAELSSAPAGDGDVAGVSYWSLDAGGRRRPDLAWSYEEPLPDGPAVAGLVAFWDERVDVYLDGELRPRPGGRVADALRDEFKV